MVWNLKKNKKTESLPLKMGAFNDMFIILLTKVVLSLQFSFSKVQQIKYEVKFDELDINCL